MVIINAYECYKITETRNRTPLSSFNCMCAAHAVNIVQVVSLLPLSKPKGDCIHFIWHCSYPGKESNPEHADVSVHKLHRVEL